MTHPSAAGWVLDTSAVLAAATGTTAYGRAVVRTAVQQGATLVVPAAALAASWGAAAPAGRLFVDLLLQLPVTVVAPLDAPSARAAGSVLNVRGPIDVGHVIATARDHEGWPARSSIPLARCPARPRRCRSSQQFRRRAAPW